MPSTAIHNCILLIRVLTVLNANPSQPCKYVQNKKHTISKKKHAKKNKKNYKNPPEVNTTQLHKKPRELTVVKPKKASTPTSCTYRKY